MKEKIFFDVDTQFDFIDPAGKLYIKNAEKIIGTLKRLTLYAEKKKITIVSSVDIHKKRDKEFKVFPPHCIAGTAGQRKLKETLLKNHIFIGRRKISAAKLWKLTAGRPQVIFEKDTYSVFANPNIKYFLKGVKEAYVYGVALDYCVKEALFGLLKMGINARLIKDATEAVNKSRRKEILEDFRRRGVRMVSAASVIR